MKRFAMFAALCISASAQTVIRQYDFVTDGNSFPQSQDVTWMQGESVRLNVTVRRGNYAVAMTSTSYPVIRAWSGSNVSVLYASTTGTIVDAASGRVRVDLNASEAAITPTGVYNYAVAVYDGTNYMGVAASGRATIKGYPFSGTGYIGVQYPFPGITGATFLGSASGGITGQVLTVNASGGSSTGNLFAVRSEVSGLGFQTNYGPMAVLTGTVAASSGAITGNQHNAILGGLTVSNSVSARQVTATSSAGLPLLALNGTTSALFGVGGSAAAMFFDGATFNGVLNGNGSGLTNLAEVNTATNVTARLASNAWAAADSTTNYARLTGGNVLLGSNVISGLSISTNTSGSVKLNLIDGNGQDSIGIYSGGFRAGPSQNAVGARLILQGTNAGGSASLSATGTLTIATQGEMTLSASRVVMNGAGIKTETSDGAYMPLFIGSDNIVLTNSNPGAGAINTHQVYYDDRSWSDPVRRAYILTTNMDSFARFAGEFWNFTDLASNFPAGYGVGIRLGPHSQTSAVYFASIETRASGTNDLDGRLSFQLASSSIGSTTERREVAYFDSARNMTVSGAVRAAAFIGDGSGLTNVTGGGGATSSGAQVVNIMFQAPVQSVTNATFTQVRASTTITNVGGYWNTTNFNARLPVGTYAATASILFVFPSATGSSIVSIRRNGTELRRLMFNGTVTLSGPSYYSGGSGPACFDETTGTNLYDFAMYQDSGSTCTNSSGAAVSAMTIVKLAN